MKFNVLIEIPFNGPPVKYESTGNGLVVSRIWKTFDRYPYNYGHIPNTRATDGDEMDVIVMTTWPLISGCHISCRALGYIDVEDQAGPDPKIFAVPTDDVTDVFKEYTSPTDFPKFYLNTIEKFLEHYKDGFEGRWTKVHGWGTAEEAETLIREAFRQY